MNVWNKGFWISLPGILTGIAAVITASTGLYIAISGYGDSSYKSELADQETYYIIMSSTSNREEAIILAKKLVALDYASSVILSSEGVYGVTLGQFATKELALEEINRAQRLGHASPDAFILPPERFQRVIFPYR